MQGNSITSEGIMHSAGPPHTASTRHYLSRASWLDLLTAVTSFPCRTRSFWKWFAFALFSDPEFSNIEFFELKTRGCV